MAPWDRFPDDLPAAQLSDNARTVIGKRYLKRDADGVPVEDPEHMFWRVARFIADVDRRYGDEAAAVEQTARRFYRLMTTGRFEPNSPTLMNAGRPLGQLSACFVLPVEDALSNGESGIYDTLTAMALIHQSGGGTGFSFSRLRPEGDVVRSSTGVASGPVSFMKLYDSSTDVVKQGGTRRGANMGILRVDHPDIRHFMTCKEDTSQITNFNISVAITDTFMKAVADGGRYDLLHPGTGEVMGSESATEIWDLLVHGAWATGEPGVFFIDRANYHNPVPHLGPYEATNPCGEQPLLPYDVCNLGSINVGAFVRPAGGKSLHDRIDWHGLQEVVHASVHFLDNVIDANAFPLQAIEDRAKAIRRIGLGIMGWADMLVRLGVAYDSNEAVELARELMGFVDEEARNASEELARTRGAFPEWEQSIWGPAKTAAKGPKGERVRPERKLRHCNLTTVAPTGTISMIAGCSGGIEPLFAVAFMRNQAGVKMADVNLDFVALAKAQGWYSESLMERIAETGHIHHPEVPDTVQQTFVTSHDIAPEWHVRMQAAFQEHTDSAISKTTNFPHEATEDDVRTIFELAYALGTKGVTVYRDGSRPMQVLSTGKTEKKDEPKAVAPAPQPQLTRQKRKRPQILSGVTVKMPSPVGDLYTTINEDEDGVPFEVFAAVGKAGGAANADTEAIGRLISLALRHGLPLEEVRDQLRGISCDRAVGFGPNKVLSAPDAMAQAIDHYLARKAGKDHQKAKVDPDLLATCPDCGSSHLAFEEGCMKCHSCGYSACG
ncbi:MAG: vitamin B12-dependent ribonucleotide reductase [Alphaproteobacteria bacterium]|nr:vitamin B12-dependent ribonucleotide reductase [Alphaproteobacteria bacterium]